MRHAPIIVSILGVIGVLIALNLIDTGEDTSAPQSEPAPVASGEPPKTSQDTASKTAVRPSPAAEPATPEPPKPDLPKFDVVRVEPNGDAVIAGRAEPGFPVDVMDGENVMGRVQADGRGEWVFIPDAPLAPGTHELSLTMLAPKNPPPGITPDQKWLSEDIVAVFVPDPPAPARPEAPAVAERTVPQTEKPARRPTQALAVQIPRRGDGGIELLQRAVPKVGKVTLDVSALDYTDQGQVTISGQAPAKSRVQVYLDNKFIGHVDADKQGEWQLRSPEGLAPGLYTLRADQVDNAGRVVARVTLPYSHDDKLPTASSGKLIVVQPGNSLWRIARQIYGEGTRFTTIFDANQERIDNPDLIYPGQVFRLPAPKTVSSPTATN